MASSKLNYRINLQELLAGAEQLSSKDLECFFERLLRLRAKRRAPHLPNKEADLLEKINKRLPDNVQNRFDYLRNKQDGNLLSKEEQKELLSIIDIIEKMDAERAGFIGELAQLRNVPVREVLKSLGVKTPVYA